VKTRGLAFKPINDADHTSGPSPAPKRRRSSRVRHMPRRRVVIDHVAVGVSGLARSRAFYVQALLPLGFSEIGPWRAGAMEISFGLEEADDFTISTAYPTGTPVHVAFAADRREQVDAFHAAAIAAGGRDNGPPGLRSEYGDGYYAAFVLDPDGHNIEAVSQQ